MRRRHYIAIAAAALLVAIFWWRCTGSGPGTSMSGPRAAPTVPTKIRVYQDGQWVTRDPGDLRHVLAMIRSRPAGLVRIQGTVLDYASGVGIPGAEVAFSSPHGESTAVTDDAGSYSLYVAAGSYRPFARADGYVAIGAAPLQRVPGQPDVSDVGAPQESLAAILHVEYDHYGVDIHLTGAAEIAGTVYNSDGRPVRGALVTAHLASGGASAGIVTVLGTHLDETDYDGSYRLTVPAGSLQLEVRHDDYAGLATGARAYLAAGDSRRIDLTLLDGCIIEGWVETPRGQRIGPGSLERHTGGSPPNDYGPATQIAADGSFRLALTYEGSLTLRAWPWKSGPSRPQTFRCADGAYFPDTVFRTEASDPALEGRLTAATGEPVPHAFIDIFPIDHNGMAQQERADDYGDWAVYALSPGLYRVTAYAPSHGTAVAIAEAPGGWVPLKFSGTATLRGRVFGIDNGTIRLRITSCQVAIDADLTAGFDDFSMPDIQRVVPISNGAFRVEGLPACKVTGSAAGNGTSTYFTAELQSGTAAYVELELGATAPEPPSLP